MSANTKIRVIIVDDEELARQVIREMLAAHPEVEVMAECSNGFDAVRLVAELKPDLIFLDIQMPKLDGFEVLELIGDELAALDRARERIGKKMASSPVELSASSRVPGQYAERIVVKDGTRVQIIPVSKLDYAEAQDDYVALAAQGKKHLKQQTISSLEAALDPKNFVRIHRSYVVNLERVTRLEPYGKDTHVVTLIDGTRLPVSRAGYTRLKDFLDRQ